MEFAPSKIFLSPLMWCWFLLEIDEIKYNTNALTIVRQKFANAILVEKVNSKFSQFPTATVFYNFQDPVLNVQLNCAQSTQLVSMYICNLTWYSNAIRRRQQTSFPHKLAFHRTYSSPRQELSRTNYRTRNRPLLLVEGRTVQNETLDFFSPKPTTTTGTAYRGT